MHFATLFTAIAAVGVSVVSAAPTQNNARFVKDFDMLVGDGVQSVQAKYPGALAVSIQGTTFDGQPTDTIMNIQKFNMVFRTTDDKWVKTSNDNDDGEYKLADSGPLIGNTAFDYANTIKIDGFTAQAEFQKKAGQGAKFTSVALRHYQHPADLFYIFQSADGQAVTFSATHAE